MISVSAPGKVILMGEHAVVYGRPALIAAISKRLTATVSKSETLVIHAPEGKSYIRHIVATVASHFKLSHAPAVQIEIISDIPIGYHLGSSAALSAALVGALSFHWKKVWNPALINQLAYEAEKFVHRNSSGVDPAAVVSGGLIWYRKELDFLRSIWQFPFRVPPRLNHFYLLDTGRPDESTGEMVSFVKKRLDRSPSAVEKSFDVNEQATKQLAIALKEGDEQLLIRAMREGERTLEHMGVVSKKITGYIRDIERIGGAAKILGGGGRKAGVGYLLCYTKKPEKSFIPLTLGEEGIRLEEKV